MTSFNGNDNENDGGLVDADKNVSTRHNTDDTNDKSNRRRKNGRLVYNVVEKALFGILISGWSVMCLTSSFASSSSSSSSSSPWSSWGMMSTLLLPQIQMVEGFLLVPDPSATTLPMSPWKKKTTTMATTTKLLVGRSVSSSPASTSSSAAAVSSSSKGVSITTTKHNGRSVNGKTQSKGHKKALANQLSKKLHWVDPRELQETNGVQQKSNVVNFNNVQHGNYQQQLSEKRVRELKDILAEKENELEIAEETISSLESIEDDLKTALDDLKETLTQTREGYEEETKQLYHAKNYLQEALSEQNQAVTELKDASKKQEALIEKLKQQNPNNDGLNEEIEKLQKLVDDKEQMIKTFHAQQESLLASMSAIESSSSAKRASSLGLANGMMDLEHVKAELSDKEELLATLKKESEALQQKLKKQQGSVGSVGMNPFAAKLVNPLQNPSSRNKLQEDLTAKEESIDKLLKEQAELEALMSELEAKATEVPKGATAPGKASSDTQSLAQEAENSVQALDMMIKSKKIDKFLDETSKLSETISQMEESLLKTESSLETTLNEKKSLEKERTELITKMANQRKKSKQDLKDKASELHRAEADRDKAQHQVDELRQKLDKIDSEYGQLQKSSKQVTSNKSKEMTDLQKSVDTLNKNLAAKEKLLDSANAQIKTLQDEVSEYSSKVTQLNDVSKQSQMGFQQELRDTVNENKVLNSNLDSTQRALDVAKKQIEDFQRQLSEANNKSRAQETQIRQAQAEKDKVKRELDGSKKEIERANTKIDKLQSSLTAKGTAASAPAPAPANRFLSNVSSGSNAKKGTQVIPQISGWTVTHLGEVRGKVKNHSSLSDGSDIVTNKLAHPNLAAANAIVETKSGSLYRLVGPAAGSDIDKNKRNSIFNLLNTNHLMGDNSVSVEESAGARIKPPPSSGTGAKKAPAAASTTTTGGIGGGGGIFQQMAQTAVPKKQPQERAEKKGQANKAAAAAASAKKLDLTGESISNGKYLLSGKATCSQNKRSNIQRAYLAGKDGNAVGKPVIVKFSKNEKALMREYQHLQKLWSGVKKGAIVKAMDYIATVDENEAPSQQGHGAIVMESGKEDLKVYSRRILMEEEALKDALLGVFRSMEVIHNAKMVWTDLKAENFVLVEDEKTGTIGFKAIDLESAMPVKGNLRDYTPEACPPEFAKAFVEGDPYKFILDYSFDVWSFGILALELSSGHGYFDGFKHDTVMSWLSKMTDPSSSDPINVDKLVRQNYDENLVDLITQCLSIDPKDRPTVQKISRHPYFSGSTGSRTGGVGGGMFGW